jgi:lipopolysaccharide/colanic/teichoic acid biosynthesis glycosyltransferase
MVSAEGHLDVHSHLTAIDENPAWRRSVQSHGCIQAGEIETLKTSCDFSQASQALFDMPSEPLSSWSCSKAKRFFDLVCVLPGLILLSPLLLVIGLAVWLTSPGPVLFLQKRMGRNGQTFTILKFRTMPDARDKKRHAVTTTDNQQFTSIGPFLRRWKMDELPQLLNVLWGDMSLVGPRPKMPEHALFKLRSRPGITGAATLAFANEAEILANVPKDHLEVYYHSVVLPAKRWIDVDYMTHATFLSDLKLIIDTVLHRWDGVATESLLSTGLLKTRYSAKALPESPLYVRASDSGHMSIQPHINRATTVEQVEAS